MIVCKPSAAGLDRPNLVAQKKWFRREAMIRQSRRRLKTRPKSDGELKTAAKKEDVLTPCEKAS